MKTLFWYATLSVATVSFCVTPAHAQEKPKEKKPWEFGVKITPGESFYYLHPSFIPTSGRRSGPDFSFILGFQAGKAFMRRWGYQLGLQLAYRTGKTDYSKELEYYSPLIGDNDWVPIQRKTTYLGLEFAPRISYKFINRKKLSLYLFAGGLIGTVLKQRDEVELVRKNMTERKTVFEDQYSGNPVWGLTLGLGVQIALNQRYAIAIEPQTQPIAYFSGLREFSNYGLSLGLIWKK